MIVGNVSENPGRYVTEDEPWILKPYIIIDFHHTRVTLTSYTILLNALVPRYMRSFRIMGEVDTEKWATLEEHYNVTPYLDPEITKDGRHLEINQRLYRYYFNIKRNGTFSRFKIKNLGPDSYTGAYQPHANILSISKLLFFGTISNQRIIFSPERVSKISANILNFGVLSVFS